MASRGLHTMKQTRIIEPTGGLIVVITDDTNYECYHDTATGDWHVTSTGDELVLDKWLLTKDDAIKYVLYRAGVVEDANYSVAPERC